MFHQSLKPGLPHSTETLCLLVAPNSNLDAAWKTWRGGHGQKFSLGEEKSMPELYSGFLGGVQN